MRRPKSNVIKGKVFPTYKVLLFYLTKPCITQIFFFDLNVRVYVGPLLRLQVREAEAEAD